MSPLAARSHRLRCITALFAPKRSGPCRGRRLLPQAHRNTALRLADGNGQPSEIGRDSQSPRDATFYFCYNVRLGGQLATGYAEWRYTGWKRRSLPEAADKLHRCENWSWQRRDFLPWAPRFIATEMANGRGKPGRDEDSCIQGQHPLGREFEGGTPLPARGVGDHVPDGSFQGQPCLWPGF